MVRAAAWLCVWVVFAAHASAQSPRPRASAAASSAFTIEAPPVLTLGAVSAVPVHYRASAELRAQLFTNIGRLAAPTQLADGSWQALYTPPSTRYPQVAIIALVSANGAQVAWTRIALQGTATVELHSDPHVQVHVRVADTEFGPVATDDSGRAALAVVVPPGVGQAISSAVDELGNERKETISLAVPPIEPLLAVCPAEDAHDFLVFAALPDTAPDRAATFTAQATPVTVTGRVEVQPGVYRVAFAIPPGVEAGELTRLSIAGRDAAISCELALPLERAERVEIQLSRAKFVASETESIAVRITPHYLGKRERAPLTLAASVSVGTLSGPPLRSREPMELTWALPHELGTKTHATLQITGDHQQQIEIELLPAPLQTLTLTLEAQRVSPNGTTTLHVIARDGYGNGVSVPGLRAQATGAVSGFSESERGRYHASYRAPLVSRGSDRIEVRDEASSIAAVQTLELTEAGGSLTLGLRVGVLTNFARVTAPLLIAEAGYRLPFWQRRLRVSVRAGYYQSRATVPTAVSADLWAVPALVRADYTFVLGRFDLAPGIGAGALGLLSQVASSATGRVREWSFLPLLAASVNAATSLGPGEVVAELGYWWASAHAQVVSGNAAGVLALIGYEWVL